MVVLGTIPDIPAPRLAALADRVEEAARDAAREAQDPFDRYMRRVSESMAMLSIAARRMSVSGPQAHLESLRRAFPEHYGPGATEDPLAGHRAHLDVISFLTTGDMVLDDIATMVLHTDDIAPGDYPWRDFIRRLDAGGSEAAAPMLTPARELDLLLREARNRLVAHRLADHSPMFVWGRDGTQELDLVNPDGVESGYRLLAEASDRLGIAHPTVHNVEPGDYYALLHPILRRARDADDQTRRLVRDAFRAAGYGYDDPVRIANAAVRLLEAAREYRRVTLVLTT